jgi:hypothetical protein
MVAFITKHCLTFDTIYSLLYNGNTVGTHNDVLETCGSYIAGVPLEKLPAVQNGCIGNPRVEQQLCTGTRHT